ncbi:MAG: Fur family transcriptional regulator [Geminicoccaceae bacterium]
MASEPRDQQPASGLFPSLAHDHRGCVSAALERAETVCSARDLRLTELRRRVLELVWGSHAPIGAYRLLELLSTERGRAAPPTVYRALEFLTREGLVHRIDSLNAYVGCKTPARTHQAYFLICSRCGVAAEFDDQAVTGSLAAVATQAGFTVTARTVELSGLCGSCATAPALSA